MFFSKSFDPETPRDRQIITLNGVRRHALHGSDTESKIWYSPILPTHSLHLSMYPEDDEKWVTGRHRRHDRIVGDSNKSTMSPIVPFPYTTQYRTNLRSHAEDVDEKLVRNCTDRGDGLQGSQFELTYRTEYGDDRTELQVKLD
jgi:hypothetical protein